MSGYTGYAKGCYAWIHDLKFEFVGHGKLGPCWRTTRKGRSVTLLGHPEDLGANVIWPLDAPHPKETTAEPQE